MLKLDINLLFTVINLVILYLLMKRFLFKPVNEIIAKRQEAADAVLASAEEKEKEAEELKAQYQASLDSVEDMKTQAMAESHEKAMEEYARITKQADEQAAEILEKAKVRAAAEQKKMLEESRDELTDMILQAGEELYMTKIGEAVDMALYQEFIDKAGEE